MKLERKKKNGRWEDEHKNKLIGYCNIAYFTWLCSITCFACLTFACSSSSLEMLASDKPGHFLWQKKVGRRVKILVLENSGTFYMTKKDGGRPKNLVSEKSGTFYMTKKVVTVEPRFNEIAFNVYLHLEN